MNIVIKNLTLTNFKCFKHREFIFEPGIVNIRGRNGAGKTTIADAVLFCLFGKNTAGQSDLELFKTRENGQVIPNLDHSVEMTLSVLSGSPTEKEITLKRSIKEVWVKKRGSEESVFKNNTVEYFVNGESYTKADYEKYIASLIDERVFRAITNPTYFPSLKWQDQRVFLTTMVGNVEPELIANTEELKELVDYLDQHDENLEAYLKHLKYQIKQVKDKLDKIPVRLEEQNKALPERLDWDSLFSQQAELSAQLKDIDSKIAAIQQGNGSDIKRGEIRKRISEINTSIDKIKHDAFVQQSAATAEKSAAISQATIKFNEALNNQKLMEQTIEADKRLIERCKETIEECVKTREELIAKWPSGKFEVDPNMAVCPTCGQPLPEDQWQEKIERMHHDFNLSLEAARKSINERGQKNNETKAKAEEEMQSYEEKLKTDTSSLADIKDSINTIFSEKAKLEKTPIQSVDERLAANVEYVALSKQLSSLTDQLNAVTDSDDNTEQLNALNQQRTECSEILSRCQQQLATRQQYGRILSLIEGINDERQDLVRQLSELEKKEDVACQYQSRQNKLLEERINQHFSLVQWKLFRTVNNGGDSFEEPFCECYVNGHPYHGGLNQAAQLNAGLDIINALCKFYKVSAPITVDNAESNLNILQTTGQQIRLTVYDSELNLV